MPKTGLCLGQRMGNFCMSFCATAGNIQAIKEMVGKKRDDRFFFLSARIATSWLCMYAFYMQHNSVWPSLLLFAVNSIQGKKYICAASVGRKICCFEDVGYFSVLRHVWASCTDTRWSGSELRAPEMTNLLMYTGFETCSSCCEWGQGV